HEQKRAGLDACSDEEFAELLRLNAAYVSKFGFPFILASGGTILAPYSPISRTVCTMTRISSAARR
ncbi:Oxo-4-hydroxy-4-carboxy-5-ureidoimidazoline decarboxylase domain protein, partial [mine drainage metagenome]